MKPDNIVNLNILSERLLPTAFSIKEKFPIDSKSRNLVLETRQAVWNILDGKEKRLILIVGPCSIHDPKAALEYAARLQALKQKYIDKFLIIMRVYFEKPRTTVGWKGFINDPELNDSFKIEEGLEKARKLLLDITQLGLGSATEALDPVVPQYLDDLISWTAIGARTTESQTHREMASGLSTAVGFKNGTDGGISVAINAIKSAAYSHHFLGVNQYGQSAVLQTKGNRYTHVVLRGGAEPNYDKVSVEKCIASLKKEKLAENIMIDCSHANSGKDYRQQARVFESVIRQVLDGNTAIKGLMLESNLVEGAQDLAVGLENLRYGQSITDGCIGWEETEKILGWGYEAVRS